MKITIYTIPDCQFSKAEKDYLTSKNLPFEEKNLESNRDFLTEMLTVSNNFAGTPVTKIEKEDGQIVVLKGFTKEEFDKELGQTSTSAEEKPAAPVSDAVAEGTKTQDTAEVKLEPPAVGATPAVPHLDLPDVSMPSMPAAPDVPPAQMPSTMTPNIQANFSAPQAASPAPSSFDPNAFQSPTQPTPVQMTPEMPIAPTAPASVSADTPGTSDTGLSSILDNLQAKVNSTPDESQPAAPTTTPPLPTQV